MASNTEFRRDNGFVRGLVVAATRFSVHFLILNTASEDGGIIRLGVERFQVRVPEKRQERSRGLASQTKVWPLQRRRERQGRSINGGTEAETEAHAAEAESGNFQVAFSEFAFLHGFSFDVSRRLPSLDWPRLNMVPWLWRPWPILKEPTLINRGWGTRQTESRI